MRAGARGGSLRSSNLHVNFTPQRTGCKKYMRCVVVLSVALLGAFTQAFDGATLNSPQASAAAPSALQVSAGEGPLSPAGPAPRTTLALTLAPSCDKLGRR